MQELHRVYNEGAEVGPDLSTISKKCDRAQLLRSIFSLLQLTDPKYVTYLVETNEGQLHTRLFLKKNANDIVLRVAQNTIIMIEVDGVEQLVPQRRSLVSEPLLGDMTTQQVGDLLEYLSSLKKVPPDLGRYVVVCAAHDSTDIRRSRSA